MYGVATWYQLNSRTFSPSVTSTNDPYRTGTQKVSPFMNFVSTATNADIKDRRFQRKISMVRKSAQLIMVMEATDPNWMEGGPVTKNGVTLEMPRIAARHGKLTADGSNAWMNICFFDGHVELKATEPLTKSKPEDILPSTGMVIFVNKQG